MSDTHITDELIQRMDHVPRIIGDAMLREHARILERQNKSLAGEIEILREKLSPFLGRETRTTK